MKINEKFDSSSFNGEPSLILDERPFYSISIACYNPNEKYFRRLLSSIVAQDMIDDIEVVLSDDCSPNNYDYLVDEYKDKLCIRRVKTDYNFCPGNTREKGMQTVTGIWAIMSDQDDMFIEGTLSELKKAIEANNIQYMLTCGFYEAEDIEGEDYNDHIIRYLTKNYGWTHGKIFNLDNFWKEFGLHFKKDMKSHEDVYMSCLIESVFMSIRQKYNTIELPFYVWYKHEKSTSSLQYKYNGEDHPFLEVFFEDYYNATAGVYIDQYILGNNDYTCAKRGMIDVCLHMYFYMQSFMFYNAKNFIKENIDIAREELVYMKKLLRMTNADILKEAAKNKANLYMTAYKSALIATGGFMPHHTLEQWLEFLDSDQNKQVKYRTQNYGYTVNREHYIEGLDIMPINTLKEIESGDNKKSVVDIATDN